MSEQPTYQDGYEVVSGDYAQQNWWPKDHHVHQCFEAGEWHRVGAGKDFHRHWTYRRPIPKPTPELILAHHFI